MNSFGFTEKLSRKYREFLPFSPTFYFYYHLTLQSIVFLRVHSWCGSFCGCGQRWGGMHPPLQHHTDCVPARRAPGLHPFIPPFPRCPGGQASFSCLHTLIFPECHMAAVMQYLPFSDWFSPSRVPLRFFQVFSWLDSSLLTVDE